MREVIPALRRWLADGTDFALATVISVQGSAPRGPGSVMAVSAAGETAGGVSGGCVEGTVFEVAGAVLETGEACRERYGIADADAFSVGLTCGGEIDVLVQPSGSRAVLGPLLDALEREEPVAVATVVDGAAALGARLCVRPDRTYGSLGDPLLDSVVAADALALLRQGATAIGHYGATGRRQGTDVAVLIQCHAPPPALLIFGVNDFAVALSRIGAQLGFQVTVCDARPVFAAPDRFPAAHEVVCDWPHRFLARTAVDERTVICVLTHDPKFDVPVLVTALGTPAGYIGAMGSRRTHEDRTDRLRAHGVTGTDLGRIHSPIGLDLGARTPEETAVSIAADIIRARFHGTGLPLSDLPGAIHRRPSPQVSINERRGLTHRA
ncbi:XdhC family protein [Streptomyces sp. NPDC051956]|uniref:XdhC family protein n=1 Tax=Streptomyces sp. NPDC051956 TaxID=3365677 RepID=UPI0037D911DA